MKYKSGQDMKYLLFFIFHMLFQYFQRVIPVTSPYRAVFNAENIIALILLVFAVFYEITARRKFDRECGNSVTPITRDEIVCVFFVIAVVIIFLFNPFHR